MHQQSAVDGLLAVAQGCNAFRRPRDAEHAREYIGVTHAKSGPEGSVTVRQAFFARQLLPGVAVLLATIDQHTVNVPQHRVFATIDHFGALPVSCIMPVSCLDPGSAVLAMSCVIVAHRTFS